MAMTKIQQELWIKSITELFKTFLIGERIANTNLIKETNADIWHIIAASDVTVSDVDDDADITYADTTDDETQVTPNFDKQFAINIKDTDKANAAMPYTQVYADRGAYKLGDALDESIFAAHADAGSNFDNGGTDWQFTKATCAEIPAFFGKLTKAAKDLDWPDQMQKYLVAPSGMQEAIITYTGGKDSAFGDSVLTQGLPNAFVYAGWNVFISNNLTTVSTTEHGLAGLVGDGIALAKQILPSGVENMRSQGRWADFIRGRLRAGHKIYRSDAVVDVEFNSTTVATS